MNNNLAYRPVNPVTVSKMLMYACTLRFFPLFMAQLNNNQSFYSNEQVMF